MAVPQIGTPAPDFTLKAHDGRSVTLSELRGSKAVVLVFYPFAFTGLCSGELCALRDDIGAFQNDSVELLAVSCDPATALGVFAEREQYPFPLLSDFWPHGAVTQAYGVFDEAAGRPVRGTFVIDIEGIVRWSVVNGAGEPRDLDAYRAALAEL